MPSDASERIARVESERSEDGRVCLEDNFPYRSQLGALLYLSMNTRPDVAYEVGLLFRLGAKSTVHTCHLMVYLMQYGTVSWSIIFSGSMFDMHIFTDADWAYDVLTRRQHQAMSYLPQVIHWPGSRNFRPRLPLRICRRLCRCGGVGVGVVGSSVERTHAILPGQPSIRCTISGRSTLRLRITGWGSTLIQMGSFGRPPWYMGGQASRHQTYLQRHTPELPSTRTGGGRLELSARVPPMLPRFGEEVLAIQVD